jgi:putative ABC transport system substrate-binding protein
MVIFADRFSGEQLSAALAAAKRARFETNVVRFEQQPYGYAAALQSARKAGADAFMNLASPIFARDRKAISEALEKQRLPSIATNVLQVEAGYLLSLNNDAAKLTRRVADIGVRLLKGAKPADIPVEQADEFELVINRSVAKRLGVKIPESVLARATRIIS